MADITDASSSWQSGDDTDSDPDEPVSNSFIADDNDDDNLQDDSWGPSTSIGTPSGEHAHQVSLAHHVQHRHTQRVCHSALLTLFFSLLHDCVLLRCRKFGAVP